MYCCLSKPYMSFIPSASSKVRLKVAGLGEKRVMISDEDNFAEQLYQELPKLREGGGFELLRASDIGGKDLIPKEIPVGG